MPPRKRFGRNQLIALWGGAVLLASVLGLAITVLVFGRGLDVFERYSNFVLVFGPATLAVILGASAVVKKGQAEPGGKP